MYSASTDNKGTKRRRRLQTSIDNTNLSSISSSLPTSTSKPTTSQPGEAPSSENAPITNEKRPTGPSEENLSAQSPDRSVAQDNEELDSDSDSSFMNLLGTVSMEVETTELEFRFPSSIDVDDPSHGAFLPDLSPFDPAVEDFLCFEPDIEPIEKLDTADNVQRPLPQNISGHAADDTGDSTIRTPPSNTMLSTSRWTLPSPVNTLAAESPARRHSLVQDHQQHTTPTLPFENNIFGSLLSVYGHDIVTLPGSTPCQCMQIALRILEELEIKNSRDDLYAADHVLSFQKRAIEQCSTMLNCKSCSTMSGFMMLLVVICEKMVSSFERITSCVEQLQQHPLPSGGLDGGGPRAGGIGDEQTVSVGEYEVDSLQEQCCLVGVLVLLQLKKLGAVLTRLKNLAATYNWGTHLTMLLSIDQRFRNSTAASRLMICDHST